jgi:hypothetical protein
MLFNKFSNDALSRSLDAEQAEMAAALIHSFRLDWPEHDIYLAMEPDLDLLNGQQLLAQLVEAAGDPDQLWPTAWPTPKVTRPWAGTAVAGIRQTLQALRTGPTSAVPAMSAHLDHQIANMLVKLRAARASGDTTDQIVDQAEDAIGLPRSYRSTDGR